jgi:hypothetical protein
VAVLSGSAAGDVWGDHGAVKSGTRADDMILTAVERAFLDVFLHEATTSPFTGPATESLHGIGVDYGDISHISWAYGQDVPRKNFEIGHPAAVVPPLPWSDREAALRRDRDIERFWSQMRERTTRWPPAFFESIRVDDPAFVRPSQGAVPRRPEMD